MNVKKYYLYCLMENLIPIYPLYLLMMENEGFSVGKISLILAIWSIPCVILEIPSGVLADRWSRKYMLVLGSFLKTLCYFSWLMSKSFYIIALGFVFWGIGSTLRSGSEEALLYDSLLMEKKEGLFDRVYGRGRFLSGVGNILAAVSGGLIGMKYGFDAALILSVISCLITTAIALSFNEANLYKEQLKEDDAVTDTLGGALSFLIKDRRLMIFAIMTLLVVSTAGIMDEYDQLIAKGFGLSIGQIGIWSALRFILIALGAYLAGYMRSLLERVLRSRDKFFLVSAIGLLSALCLLVAGRAGWKAAIFIYGLYYLFLSAAEVIQEDYIQKRIENEGRSTVHSVISLSLSLYSIACFGLFGLAASGGVMRLLILCGIYICICIAVTGSIYLLAGRKAAKKAL